MRRRSAGPAVGLESLIDVLTNTIGALALLCMLAALEAGNLRWRLFISEGRVADTVPLSLVVRAGHVRHLDSELLARRVAGLPAGSHRLPATAALPFEVEVARSSGGEAALELFDDPRFAGTPVVELLDGRGELAARIRRLDPRTHHVFLYLAPDSFRHYLDLRSSCQASGLRLGWTTAAKPLRLVYGGSSTGRPMSEVVEIGD